MEDNDKDDDNNDKDISALGLDRDMGFSRGPSYGTQSKFLSATSGYIRYHVGFDITTSTQKCLSKIFLSQISQLWELIETWGFR